MTPEHQQIHHNTIRPTSTICPWARCGQSSGDTRGLDTLEGEKETVMHLVRTPHTHGFPGVCFLVFPFSPPRATDSKPSAVFLHCASAETTTDITGHAATGCSAHSNRDVTGQRMKSHFTKSQNLSRSQKKLARCSPDSARRQSCQHGA